MKIQLSSFSGAVLAAIDSMNAGRQDDWFHPYVGLPGRYNFNKAVYTAVRGEIGDFENDNFKFDVVMHGPRIATGITF